MNRNSAGMFESVFSSQRDPSVFVYVLIPDYRHCLRDTFHPSHGGPTGQRRGHNDSPHTHTHTQACSNPLFGSNPQPHGQSCKASRCRLAPCSRARRSLSRLSGIPFARPEQGVLLAWHAVPSMEGP